MTDPAENVFSQNSYSKQSLERPLFLQRTFITTLKHQTPYTMKNKQQEREAKVLSTPSNELSATRQVSKEAITELQKQLKYIPVNKRYSFSGTIGGYQGL